MGRAGAVETLTTGRLLLSGWNVDNWSLDYCFDGPKLLGTGGALEGREIVLQGDRRDTAKAWLLKEGFTTNL